MAFRSLQAPAAGSTFSAPGASSAWPAPAFAPQGEREVTIERVEGRLPDELEGTFYRVGPGALDVGGRPNGHWFDGDGLVCALRLARSGGSFLCRFVRTPWYEREQRADRRLFSAFASVAPTLRGHLRRPKNPANTNVVPFEGSLLALYEAGRPFALDARTLATQREETFGGTLPPWAGFSAHPHLDRASGRLVSVGLGVRLGARGLRPVAETWEVGPGLRARRGVDLPLRSADVVHSVGLTARKVVVLAGPYGLDVRRLPGLLLARRGLFDCVRWRPTDPLTVYVGDRTGRAPPVVYELPAGFVIHVANAFEQADEVVVDAVLHPDPSLIDALRLPFTDPRSPPGRLVRLRLGPRGRVACERLSDTGMEFPTVRPDRDGQPHRYVYAGKFERQGACAPGSSLLKIDTIERRTHEHDLGERCFFGEPVFVPRPGGTAEDDGWVLSLAYDGSDHHSFLCVLRADGWDEVARLHLPFHVPAGLHATFCRSPLAP